MSPELGLAVACGAAAALWAWTTQGRETADRVSSTICRDFGLQRLDGSVTLKRLGLERRAGALAVARVYRFEYSLSGAERLGGEVGLVNGRPEWARIEHPDGPIHLDL
ncbi:MAG: DUF3301 domain-containing protein [Gammaproteobacteria bacterium]